MVPQLESEPSVCQFDEEPETAPFAIPEKWKWTKLGEIGRWKAGGTPPRSHPEYFQKGHIPWLKTGDLTDGSIESVEEYITEAAIKNSSAYINPIGSVLIAMYGATIGKLGILEFPCATNQACCACDVNTQICDRWYLFYYLLSQRKAFIAQGAGGAQPNISRTKIVNYWIPLPPLEEQIRIITKVKQLFEQIDCAEEAYNELTGALSERFRQLCLERAIQGKLVPQLESEPKVNRISISIKSTPFHIPEKWQWCKLSDVVEIQNGDRGKNYPSKDKLTTNNTGLPFVSAVNLENLQISPKNLLYLQPEQYEKLRAGHIKAGDCLLCIRGSLGKFGFAAQSGGAIASSLVILRSKGDGIIFPKFLRIFLQSPFFAEQIKTNQNGTAQPNLSAKDLSNFLMPIPPVTEQQRIVCKFEEIHNTLIAIA